MPSLADEKMWFETWELAGVGLRCNAGTLSGWRRYCPLLGEKLRTKSHETDRRKILWFGPHIRRLVLARRSAPDEFEHGGFRWVWAQCVQSKFGIAPNVLLRLWKHHGLGAPREQLGRTTRRGSANGRHVHRRIYYRYDQVAEVAAAYKEAARVGRCTTSVFVDRGVRWWSAPWLETEEARAAGLFFRRHSLWNWSRVHCPWLGKKLSVRRMLGKMPNGRLAWTNFYKEAELLEIKRLERNPPHPDLAGLAEAKRDYRLSQALLANYCRRDNPQLHNQRLSRVFVPLATRSYGQTLTLKRRPGYPKAKLEVLRDRPPVPPPDPALWISRRAAAHEAAVSDRTIGVWRNEGYRGSEGKRLRIRSRTFLVQVGGAYGTRLMNVVYLSRPDFDAVLALRAAADTWESLYTDSEGTWCRPLYLRKVYGWHRPRLAQFRKSCPPLGRPIAAKLIPRPAGTAGRPLGWGYLKVDVDRLATALKGGSGAIRSTDRSGVGQPKLGALALAPAIDAMPEHTAAKKVKRRRRLAEEEKVMRYAIRDAWHRARDSGLSRTQFCASQNVSLDRLKKTLVWCINDTNRKTS